jgi:alginate O-acetyltransferase complex protein AlgI
MFGFRFLENFNYPYISRSIQEFWRRWHISLSAWFRDYVYVPLGGNRVKPSRLYLNLITVFFLCGLWHGASWTFVVWGLFHGAFLVIERVGLAQRLKTLPSAVQHGYALIVAMVGWVFFRADSFAGAAAMLKAMAGFGEARPTIYTVSWYLTPELLLALAAGIIASTPIAPALAAWWAGRNAAPGDAEPALGWVPSAVGTAALTVLLAASVMLIAARTYNPFIYFRF